MKSEYLVFLLSAPLASFGGFSGHERRGSGTFPLRSAILGLIGAALGIDRVDKVAQAQLRKYSVAVQPLKNSEPLRDYHTVQTVPTPKVKQPGTRKIALEQGGRELNTIITLRDYRCDVLIGVAIWGSGAWQLEQVADCLRRPAFPLYLGRKSCPLALPVNPAIIVAEEPVEALSQVEIPEILSCENQSLPDRTQMTVYSDPVDCGAIPPMSEQLPSEPIDRQDWTFENTSIWHLTEGWHQKGKQA